MHKDEHKCIQTKLIPKTDMFTLSAFIDHTIKIRIESAVKKLQINRTKKYRIEHSEV